MVFKPLISALFYLSSAFGAEPRLSTDDVAIVFDNATQLLSSTGSLVRMYTPESEPKLREEIDRIMETLMRVPMGLRLCGTALHADARLIEYHLGVSRETASRIALRCLGYKEAHLLVSRTSTSSLDKFTMLQGFGRRLYSVLVLEEAEWPFDSWTEPFSNQTVLVVSKTRLNQELNRAFLTRLLAHETAVYFDSKSWPMGPGWKNVEEFRNIDFVHPNLSPSEIMTASLNPIAFHSLTSIRAFRAEEQWLREVASYQGLWSYPDPAGAASQELGDQNCEAFCLKNHLQELGRVLLPYSRALMAYSPNYLSMRRAAWVSQTPTSRPDSTDVVSRFFSMIAEGDFTRLFSNQPFLDLVSPLIKADGSKENDLWRQYTELMWNQDLKILDDSKMAAGVLRSPALNFLANPYLSGENIKFARGPRPRIRTGEPR